MNSFDFIAPSSAPDNVNAYNLSSTSIVVTWSPVPDELLNGILQSYRVFLRQASDVEISPPMKFILGNTSLSVIISSLKKFTVYSVWVAAVTVLAGPNSSVVIVSTDEDGKCHLFSVYGHRFIV